MRKWPAGLPAAMRESGWSVTPGGGPLSFDPLDRSECLSIRRRRECACDSAPRGGVAESPTPSDRARHPVRRRPPGHNPSTQVAREPYDRECSTRVRSDSDAARADRGRTRHGGHRTPRRSSLRTILLVGLEAPLRGAEAPTPISVRTRGTRNPPSAGHRRVGRIADLHDTRVGLRP